MKCLRCGWAHDSLDRCEVAARKRVVVHGVANAAPLVANEKSRHGVYADLEKRRGYMRELMSRKRAAAKQAKGA